MRHHDPGIIGMLAPPFLKGSLSSKGCRRDRSAAIVPLRWRA